MGANRRQALTLAVGGLLLMAGCTGGGPRGRPAAPAAAVPSLPATPTTSVASVARSPGRVLGVVWHGKPGAESAELAWLDSLSLRPRPGRRLPLGQHGVGWAVAPDQSLAVFAGGGDRNDGRLLVVDSRRLRRLGAIRLRQVGSGRMPPAGWSGRGCCWPAAALSRDPTAT